MAVVTERPVVLDPFPLNGPLPADGPLTERLLSPLNVRSRLWKAMLLFTGMGTLALFSALYYTFATGIGTWGNNIPVGWAYGITNFVWWIGIGHAGTFISAILLLFEQKWRTSINRLAEAMTLFAVANAGLFPVAHMGRPWFAYWLIPYPGTMGVWPQFKSALAWDIAAISTYGLVSLLFWYLGLVPDFAQARDSALSRTARKVYGVFALGWRGSVRHWRHYRAAYWLLAGLATPLVLSVHSIVSLDFSITVQPGWRGTLFPPYFVAGAIFSGFAMVLTLLIPTRYAFRLHDVVTGRHLENMAKVILATGSIVAYAYLVEAFAGWYTGDIYEKHILFGARPEGQFAFWYWAMIFCNVLVPQLLWIPFFRRRVVALFVVSILVNVGMWLERFVIVVISLQEGHLPSSWASYAPTWVDWTIFLGSISFFLFLYLLFIRFVPFIPIMEMKEMRAHDADGHHEP